MQKDDFLDKDSFYSETGFEVTNRAKGFLVTTAFWGKIIAIVGFIVSGLMILAGIIMTVMGAGFAQFDQMGAFGELGGIGITFIYISGALIYFFPSLYLFNFSQKVQSSIRNSDGLELEEAFKNLKSLYKFIGILTVVILAIYGLAFIFALIVGANA